MTHQNHLILNFSKTLNSKRILVRFFLYQNISPGSKKSMDDKRLIPSNNID